MQIRVSNYQRQITPGRRAERSHDVRPVRSLSFRKSLLGQVPEPQRRERQQAGRRTGRGRSGGRQGAGRCGSAGVFGPVRQGRSGRAWKSAWPSGRRRLRRWTRRPARTPNSPSPTSAALPRRNWRRSCRWRSKSLPGVHHGPPGHPDRPGRLLCAGRALSAVVGADHDHRSGQGCGGGRGDRLPAAQRASGDGGGVSPVGCGPDLPDRRRAGDCGDGLRDGIGAGGDEDHGAGQCLRERGQAAGLRRRSGSTSWRGRRRSTSWPTRPAMPR